MGANKNIRSLNNKGYFWTVLGVVLTIGGLVFTVCAFFREVRPELEISILSRINVLDINASVSSMDITLDSVSLKKNNENVKIYNIRVINTGNADITTELFDVRTPLGIRIENGYLLEKPELTAASNDYLKDRVLGDLNFVSENFFTIPSVILDRKDFFDLKFLVVHHNDSVPELSVVGKISGQKCISISESIENVDDMPFWKNVFSGTVGVQLTRLSLSLVIWIFIIGFVVLISSAGSAAVIKFKRKKAVKQFKLKFNIKKSEECILQAYEKYGYEKIYYYREILNMPLEKIYRMFVESRNDDYSASRVYIRELMSLDVIRLDKGAITVERKRKDIINKLYMYLKYNGFREGYVDFESCVFTNRK